MTDVPPPLAWLPSLADSMERALGFRVRVDLHPTVNPLVYTVKFFFEDSVPSKLSLKLWNLVQQYAVKNDCVPEGKVMLTPFLMVVRIVVKRRLGMDKNETP